MNARVDNLVGVVSGVACCLAGMALSFAGLVAGLWATTWLAHWTFRRRPRHWESRFHRVLGFAIVLVFAAMALHIYNFAHAPKMPDATHVVRMNNHGDVRWFTRAQHALSMEMLGLPTVLLGMAAGWMAKLAGRAADPAYRPPTFGAFTRPLRRWMFRYAGVIPPTPGPSPPPPEPSRRGRRLRRERRPR